MGDLVTQIVSWVSGNPGAATVGGVGIGAFGGLTVWWVRVRRALQRDLKEQKQEIEEATDRRFEILEKTVETLQRQLREVLAREAEKDAAHAVEITRLKAERSSDQTIIDGLRARVAELEKQVRDLTHNT